jgi:hypothetical protein
MSDRLKKLMFGSTLPTAVLFSLAASTAALAEARSAAEFVLTICRPAMKDVAKVDAMAQEKNWTAAPEAAAGTQSNGFKLRSGWTATEGDDKFMVMTGVGQVAGSPGDSNFCIVTFPHLKVRRDEFVDAISGALELRAFANMTFPQGRMEIFEIDQAGPEKQLLQLMSFNDGNALMASMIGIPAPAGDQ